MEVGPLTPATTLEVPVQCIPGRDRLPAKRLEARPPPVLTAALHHLSGRMSDMGLVSRVTPVHTVLRNCMRDEGWPFEFGNQVLISSYRKLLSSKAMVVNVAGKSGHDPVGHG
jgi:hypothetical protein